MTPLSTPGGRRHVDSAEFELRLFIAFLVEFIFSCTNDNLPACFASVGAELFEMKPDLLK